MSSRVRVLFITAALILVASLCVTSETAALVTARQSLEEKSYAIAARQFDAALALPLSTEERREAMYGRATCSYFLEELDSAQTMLEKLVAEQVPDKWRGLALWRSALITARKGIGEEQATTLTRQLREAAEIIAQKSPDQYGQFLRSVLSDVFPRWWPQNRAQIEFQLEFYQKAIAATKEIADIAELHRQRAEFKRAHELVPETEYVKELRTVVTEFPNTAAARNAQVTIARLYAERGNLVQAVEEWKKVTELWGSSPEAREAEAAVKQILQEFLDLRIDPSIAIGSPIRIELVGRNVSRCTVEFFRMNPHELLALNDVQSRLPQLVGDKSPVLAKQVRFAKRDDHYATTSSLLLDPQRPDEKLPAGIYLVRCSEGQARAYALTVVGNLVLLATTSGQTTHFWVTSADTGVPRQKAQIWVQTDLPPRRKTKGSRSSVGGQEKPVELLTDENGFAQLDFDRDASSATYCAVANEGEDWALLAPQYAAFWRPIEEQGLKCYAYTDRPAYRPGDTVYWRAILRQRISGQYELPKGKRWQATVFDPRGTKVTNEFCSLSEFGTLTSSLKIPAGAALGLWRLDIADEKGNSVGQAQFRVEEYKKPEFEVIVTSKEKIARLGAEVPIELEARYLFGAPVSGATVQYTVTAQPMWWWPRPPLWSHNFEWFAEREMEERAPYWHRSGVEIASGQAVTDSEGRCSFTFTASVPERVEKTEFVAYNFTVTATVTDVSRRAIEGSTVVSVGTRALRIQITPDHRVYTPGDLAKFAITTTNLAGDPVASRGKIAVEKLTWDAAKRIDIPTTLALEALEVTTETEALYQWRIPKDLTGRLRIVYMAEDPFGGTTFNSSVVDVADAQTHDLGIRYQGIQLIADKDLYEIGESARLLLLSEYPDATAWVWVDTGSGIIRKQAVPLRGRTTILELPITDQYVPNVSIRTVVVHGRQVLNSTQEVRVPPKRQILDVQVRSDRSTYKPRENGILELRVRDWEGKPVQGEFSLTVYDKAIEYIQPSLRVDIRRYFYGDKRSIPFAFAESLTAGRQYHNTIPSPGPYDYELLRSWRDKEEFAFGAGVMPSAARADAMLPTAAAPVMMKSMAQSAESANLAQEEKAGGEPIVRTDFRDSALWIANVVTDAEGKALVPVTFPDSLTTWRIETVGVDDLQRVGEATTVTLVQKTLSARLATPRFLTQRDSATISAIVRNDGLATKTVRVKFEARGVEIAAGNEPTQKFCELAPKGQTKFDWTVRANMAGQAVFQASAWTEDDSDASETTIPVVVHGMDKFVYRVGSTTDVSTGTRRIGREGSTITITDELEIPDAIVKESAQVRLLLSPSVATQLRQALPYLVEYPYGCVEQTMSRFLPAAIVAKTFQELDIPRDELLEKRLPEVMSAGIERLRDFQQADGSWGWWKGSPTDYYMTAYVMFGLTLARQADYAVPEAMFRRGLDYLERSLEMAKAIPVGIAQAYDYDRGRQLHALAYACLVLTLNGRPCAQALDVLWQVRDQLSPMGLAMVARALQLSGQHERAGVAMRNLMNFAVAVDENDTIHWESRAQQNWFWWWNDNVETTCMTLMALLEASPQAPEIDKAVKWLVLNRRGARWRSTKDTGLAVMALAQYLKVRRPEAAPTTINVKLGNLPPQVFTIDAKNFFTAQPEILVEGRNVPAGKLPLRLEIAGRAPIYYTLSATYFTLEEPITSASHEIVVERRYQRHAGQIKKKDGSIEEKWLPLREGDALQSGDRLRVTLSVRAFNDFEYLVFEDPKPAGCEPVQIQSGWTCDGSTCGYREYRDQMVTTFVSSLGQGQHEFSYELRAETPGKFHALPARGYAMYCPEVHGNSDEVVISIVDK
jgi:uncharacterized protein YfaS (alpha-2-macroglobulin family)/outer membrane protein assembly factor BamD (BamD/ComL family)